MRGIGVTLGRIRAALREVALPDACETILRSLPPLSDGSACVAPALFFVGRTLVFLKADKQVPVVIGYIGCIVVCVYPSLAFKNKCILLLAYI
jgi:hypothetical protein